LFFRFSSVVTRIVLIVAIAFAGLLFAGAQSIRAQDPSAMAAQHSAPNRQPPAADLVIESMCSFGNYRLFAGGSNAKLYTGGIEYDRHSWGYWLGARRDYAAEFLPVMVLNEPSDTDIWGDRLRPGRKILYGVGIAPVGVRLVWRDGKGIKPWFSAKGGVLAFDDKVLSRAGTYEQFTLEEEIGLMVKTSPRYDLRLGMFGDFHFSNGFTTNVNPGLDVMNVSVGLVYHLGSRKSAVASALPAS
jgi:hypothetical protein